MHGGKWTYGLLKNQLIFVCTFFFFVSFVDDAARMCTDIPSTEVRDNNKIVFSLLCCCVLPLSYAHSSPAMKCSVCKENSRNILFCSWWHWWPSVIPFAIMFICMSFSHLIWIIYPYPGYPAHAIVSPYPAERLGFRRSLCLVWKLVKSILSVYIVEFRRLCTKLSQVTRM